MDNLSKKPDINDPLHPYHRLYEQAYGFACQEDAKRGRTPDDTTKNLAASLTVLAAENNFKGIDRVAFSVETNRLKAGENVFVVQGEPPSHLRAHMPTAQALEKESQHSFSQLDVLAQKQATQQIQAPSQTQDQAQQRIDDPNNPGPHKRSL